MSSLRLSFTATTANRWNRCRCGWLLNFIGNQALMLRFPLLMPLVSDCPHRPASVWYAYCPLRSDEVCSRIWGQGFCVRSPVSEAPVPEIRFPELRFPVSRSQSREPRAPSPKSESQVRVPSPSSKSEFQVRVPSPSSKSEFQVRVPSPSSKSEFQVRVPSPKLSLYILVVS